MKGFLVIFFDKKKKNQEIAFQGPQRIVAGTGAGRQTLFPGEWGVEKRPGIPHGIPKYVIEILLFFSAADKHQRANHRPNSRFPT